MILDPCPGCAATKGTGVIDGCRVCLHFVNAMFPKAAIDAAGEMVYGAGMDGDDVVAAALAAALPYIRERIMQGAVDEARIIAARCRTTAEGKGSLGERRMWQAKAAGARMVALRLAEMG